MQTLPSNFLNKSTFNSWTKFLIVVSYFLAPLLLLAFVFNYSGIFSDFIQRFVSNPCPPSPQPDLGAPIDPRYGQSSEVCMMRDYGYDTARDITRIVTVMSSFISSYLTFKVIFMPGFSKLLTQSFFKGLSIQYGIPIAVHLIGTFAINNYGGIGGGL